MSETMFTCCTNEVFTFAGIAQHLVGVHGLPVPIDMEERKVVYIVDEGITLETYQCAAGGVEFYKTVKTSIA